MEAQLSSTEVRVSLADRLEDHRRRPADRPADQVTQAVAVVDLGQAPVDVHMLAVRAGGHVTAGQRIRERLRRQVEFTAEDGGQAAFLGLDDGAGVMRDQTAQHRIACSTSRR
jgi:predicted ABC-type ATPase